MLIRWVISSCRDVIGARLYVNIEDKIFQRPHVRKCGRMLKSYVDGM